MDLLLVIVPAALIIGAIVLVVARNNRYRRPLPDAPLDEPEWPPAHPEPPDPPHEVEVEEPEPEPPIILPPEPEPERPQHEREGDVEDGTLAAWPNAPGWPVILDTDCSNLQPDWPQVLWNERGLVTVQRDNAAPFSPPGVIRVAYPEGYVGGAAPGTPVKSFPQPLRQVYVGCWLKFSAGWQGHGPSGVSKIHYLFSDSGSIPIVIYGDATGPFYLRMFPQFGSLSTDPALMAKVRAIPPRLDHYGEDAYARRGWLISNVTPVPVPIGEWFQLEVLIDALGPESVTQFFLNRVIQGQYEGVSYPAGGFTEFKLASVWGGSGDVKRQADHIWYDHVLVQGR